MTPTKADFTRQEWEVIERCRTPAQVQRFLTAIPYNRETEGKTCLTFRRVVGEQRTHCLEGAMAAAVIFEQRGRPPLLVSIESQDQLDHVLFLYRVNDRYGAIARSRDLGLHGRKAVFRTVRELVMSYFDPYVDKTGRITGYAVANLLDLGSYDWRLSTRNVWKVERFLQDLPHTPIARSEARYQKCRQRYLEFHAKHPHRSPAYFQDRYLWLL